MEQHNQYELYSVDRYLEDYELEHSGVKGQRWGVRRYQNPDGSLTPLGRERLSKQQVRSMRREDRRQAKAQKQEAKQEHEAEKIYKKKVRLLKKGNTDAVLKNASLFSDQELNAYVNRKRIESNLSSMSEKANKPVKEKRGITDLIVSGVNTGEKLFNSYLKGAEIVNKISGTQLLPTFMKKEGGLSKLYKLSMDEIVEQQGSITTAELEDLAKRSKALSTMGVAAKSQYLPKKSSYKGGDWEAITGTSAPMALPEGTTVYDITTGKNGRSKFKDVTSQYQVDNSYSPTPTVSAPSTPKVSSPKPVKPNYGSYDPSSFSGYGEVSTSLSSLPKDITSYETGKPNYSGSRVNLSTKYTPHSPLSDSIRDYSQPKDITIPKDLHITNDYSIPRDITRYDTSTPYTLTNKKKKR